MNTAGVLSLVEQLEDNIDDLDENLEPLLKAGLFATTKTLPVLEKAKLYVVVVYAIESLLFSYLRLHGVAAKEHAVFRELTRVKQYFEKIKLAEEGAVKPRENLSLNKEAAGRIISHALAGNDRYDLERAEREARERFLAKRKLKDLETRMKEKANSITNTANDELITAENDQLKSEIGDENTQTDQSTTVEQEATEILSSESHESSNKKRGKRRHQESDNQTSEQPEAEVSPKKLKKKAKKNANSQR